MTKKKIFSISLLILLTGAALAIYFYFRPPRTLGEIVGSQFMKPDHIFILNGGTGDRRELKDSERTDMLELLQKAEIQNIESIGAFEGSTYIQLIKGNDKFTLSIAGEYCFRTKDPDDTNQMILYHVDKDSYQKIKNLMGFLSNMYTIFRVIAIFLILIMPIHEHGRDFDHPTTSSI